MQVPQNNDADIAAELLLLYYNMFWGTYGCENTEKAHRHKLELFGLRKIVYNGKGVLLLYAWSSILWKKYLLLSSEKRGTS